jgi:hypothetical protein
VSISTAPNTHLLHPGCLLFRFARIAPEGKPVIYEPISKVVTWLTHFDGSRGLRGDKKKWLFSFVCCGEDDTPGAPNCTYTCHTIKVKSESDLHDIDYAIRWNLNGARVKPKKDFDDMDLVELENAVKWWNAGKRRVTTS